VCRRERAERPLLQISSYGRLKRNDHDPLSGEEGRGRPDGR
jgi:hypothetical protein